MGAAPASAASTSGTGPATVVRAFFTAISNHNWQQVWSLGGKNLNRRPPYNTPSGMAEGYRCTVNDEIKTISASGQTVSGRFVAHEAATGSELNRLLDLATWSQAMKLKAAASTCWPERLRLGAPHLANRLGRARRHGRPPTGLRFST